MRCRRDAGSCVFGHTDDPLSLSLYLSLSLMVGQRVLCALSTLDVRGSREREGSREGSREQETLAKIRRRVSSFGGFLSLSLSLSLSAVRRVSGSLYLTRVSWTLWGFAALGSRASESVSERTAASLSSAFASAVAAARLRETASLP